MGDGTRIIRGDGSGQELWADRGSPYKKTVPVKVRCETKSSGEKECNIVTEFKDIISGNEDKETAHRQVFSWMTKRRIPPPAKKDTSKTTAVAIGTTMTAEGWFPWVGTGADAVAKAGSVVAVGEAFALPIIAAAIFGPSQAEWNERNQLIQFATVKEEDITINVIFEKNQGGRPVSHAAAKKTEKREDAKEVEEAENVLSSGNPGPPEGNNRPPNGHRTWREAWRDLRDKASRVVDTIRRPNRRKRLGEWYRNRLKTAGEKIRERKSEMPRKGRLRWFANNIKNGFKKVIRERVDVVGNTAKGLKEGTVKVARNPLGETLDFINRPGKFLKYSFNGYGIASLMTAGLRWLTGSDKTKTNPLGSELLPEGTKGVTEPILGMTGATSIGALVEHYIFGWDYRAAILFESIFALQPVLFQKSSGGAGVESFDWNRINKNTFTNAFIWGWLGPYKKISNAAFPGLTWAGYLARLEAKGHKTLLGVLRAVPTWMAPKNIPTWKDYVTYSGLVNLHSILFAIIPDAVSSEQDLVETAKYHGSRMSSIYLFTRWFDAAFDPFSRPLMGVVSPLMKVWIYSEYAKFFQLYKGKKFYRKIFKNMAKDDVLHEEAIETVATALATKRLFNDNPEFVWEDCYDFYNDLRNGEFNDEEIEYFIRLATSENIHEPRQKDVQSVLKDIITGRFESKEDLIETIEKWNEL